MGAFKAGTGAREISSGIQRRDKVKNTRLHSLGVALSLSHHGLSLQK